jgi:hypothetical protein
MSGDDLWDKWVGWQSVAHFLDIPDRETGPATIRLGGHCFGRYEGYE